MPTSIQEALQCSTTLHLTNHDRVNLRDVLNDLYETHRVQTLVCEGGPLLAKGLAEIDAIDELFVTIAPILFGGAGAPGILGIPGTFLPSSRVFQLASMKVEAAECYLHYLANRP